MNRAAIVCLLALASAALGAVGDGCLVDSLGGLVGAMQPAIIPTNPGGSTMVRTFTVDLRDYPQTARINWDFGDGGFVSDLPVETGRSISHEFTAAGTFEVKVYLFTERNWLDGGRSRLIATGTLPIEVGDAATTPTTRSITPDFGEVGSTDVEVIIEGEDFADGATARMENGGARIVAKSTEVLTATRIRARFDLTGAATGDYTVTVENPDASQIVMPGLFRVVTPNLVRLKTSMGDILLDLVDDAPITTGNFLQYVEDKFYDGTIIHRVVKDFVVQGGGYLPGLVARGGKRGPIVNEFGADRPNVRGTVAMAKIPGDPDSATSEFFVNLVDNSADLDTQNGGYAVFANVIEGMDVIDDIAEVAVDSNDQPLEDIVLIRARRE